MGEEQCKLIEDDLKKMLFHPVNLKEKLPEEQNVRRIGSFNCCAEIDVFPQYSDEWPALGTDSTIPKVQLLSKKEQKGIMEAKSSKQSYSEDEVCDQYNKEHCSPSYREAKNVTQQRRGSQERHDFKYADKGSRWKGGQKIDDSVGTKIVRHSSFEGTSFGKQFSNSAKKNKPKLRQLRSEERNANRSYYHTPHIALNGNVEELSDSSGNFALNSFSLSKDRTKNRGVDHLTSNHPKPKAFQPFQDKKKFSKTFVPSPTYSSDASSPVNSSVIEIDCNIRNTPSEFSKCSSSEVVSESNLNVQEHVQRFVATSLENEEVKQIRQQKERKKKKKKKCSMEKEGTKKSTKDATLYDNSNLLSSAGEPDNKTSIVKVHPKKRDTASDVSQLCEMQQLLNNSRGSGEIIIMPSYPPDIIASLRKDYVKLKKCNLAIKKPSFYCQVCMISCPELSGAQRHITTASHKEKKEIEEFEETLRGAPSPLPIQVEAITELLLTVAEREGLSAKNDKHRQSVVTELNKLVKSELPGCELELIGSSANGFGLKSSDADIVLHVPDNSSSPDMLNATYELLKKDENYVEVICEFKEKIPRILLIEKQTMLKCNISLSSGSVCSTTKLLSDYCSIDSRAKILGVCFRYWAKLCEIDQQKNGTLPSFCFPIMLIYFLQQQNPPVLPVLHELAGDADGDVHLDPSKIPEKWKCENTESVGELWIRLFRFYSVFYQCGIDVVSIRHHKVITCKDKNWGTKFLAIEDPFARRNLARSIPNHMLFRYVRDCFKLTYKYFGFPQLMNGPLLYEVTAFDSKTVSPEPPKHDYNRRLGLKIAYISSDEDSVSSTNLQDHFEDHDPDISLDSVIDTISRLSIDSSESEECELESGKASVCVSHDEDKQHEESAKSTLTLDEKSELSLLKSEDTVIESSSDVLESCVNKPSSRASSLSNEKDLDTAVSVWKTEGMMYTKSDMQYHFKKKKIVGNMCPPIVCRNCQKQGHRKKNCPELKLPEVHPLPPMTAPFMRVIDKLCEDIMRQNAPGTLELAERDAFLQDLQDFIKHEFFKNSHLQMFGSCCNGFGFINSDMDICLTFDKSKNGNSLNHTALIEELAVILKRKRKLYNVLAITSAKVPIVKFTYRGSSILEGDISLYNTLAQHNTRMLSTYSKIDQRVQILGYMMKYFAKILDICDASRGSLSSYAYILMVLFYLQQINPPVIPVLQELYEGKMPEEIIDGWNAWFYDDLENLPSIWPHYRENLQSVGELWLGLLCFYTEKFDLKEYVISIRQKEPLSRFKKLWNSKSIAIEDPFDLNHNLGSGLSRKMNLYIMKAFIRARQLFGTPLLAPPAYYNDFQGYLFSKKILSEGKNPPNDRGCRACGKIGHIVKDCPKRRGNRPSYQRDGENKHFDMRDIGPGGGPLLWRENHQRMKPQKRRKQQGKLTPPSPHLNYYDRLFQTHSKMQELQNQGGQPVNTALGKNANMAQGILPLPLSEMSGYPFQAQNMPFFLQQGVQTANQINQSLTASQKKSHLPGSCIPPFAGTVAVTRPTHSIKSSTTNSQLTDQHLMRHPQPQYRLSQNHYRMPSQSELPQQSHVQKLSPKGPQQQQQSLLGMHPQQQLHLQHMYQHQNMYHPNVQQQQRQQQNPFQNIHQHAQEHQKQLFSTVSQVTPQDSSTSNLQGIQLASGNFSTQTISGVSYSKEIVQSNSSTTEDDVLRPRRPMSFPHHDEPFPKRCQ